MIIIKKMIIIKEIKIMFKNSLNLVEKNKKNKRNFLMMTKLDMNKISIKKLKMIKKMQFQVTNKKRYVNIVTQEYKYNLSKLKKVIN